jgi:hypothetical protein
MFLPGSLGITLPRALLDPVDESLWNPDTGPPGAAVPDAATPGINLGCLFTTQVIGEIHSLCYYRATGMASSGTLSLWSIHNNTDVLLGQVSFTGHATVGWKVVALSASVTSDPLAAYVVGLWTPAAAGICTYVATGGYFSDRGHYSENQFLYASVSNGQIDPRLFLRRNGLYAYGSLARPTEFFNNTNYWVDVVIFARPKPIPAVPPVFIKWAIPGGYPSLANTGPAPGTVFTTELEDVSSSADGQVIEDLDVHGAIAIQHNNVTVQNCKASAGVYSIYVYAGTTGATIQDCDINGVGRGNAGSAGIFIAGASVQCLRNNIYRVENGIALSGSNGPVLIKDNFIHNLHAGPETPHYDGLQCDGRNDDTTIDHNTIFNENGGAAAIMIDNFAGASDAIVVKDNYAAGAGYTCYCDAGFDPTGAPLTNVSFLRNILRPGGYGYWAINSATPIRQGNRFLEHGSIFDTPPPGGFTVGQVVPECFYAINPDGAGSVIGETVAAATGLTVGLSFMVWRTGTITGLNFFRPEASSTASHKIGLWRWLGANKSEGVELIGTTTVSDVNRTGWTGFEFSAPLAVNAGDNLLIGIFIPRGSDGKVWFTAANGAFDGNVPGQYNRMIAFNNTGTPINGFIGCNGMYAYGADLMAPVNAGGAGSNYCVDPVYATAWS